MKFVSWKEIFHTGVALEKNNIYVQFTWLKVSFLYFQPSNIPAQSSPPAMGAGACKDKVFVLDLNIVFLLSRLESRANESKVICLISAQSFNILHCLSLTKTPNEVKIGQIKFDWRRESCQHRFKDSLLNFFWMKRCYLEYYVVIREIHVGQGQLPDAWK